MASSTNGVPPSLSPNGSQNLLANEIMDLDAEQKLERQWLKVRMADHLRLMQDNSRVLDMTAADDQALRRQRHEVRNVELVRYGGQPVPYPESARGSDDMGTIQIDSPVIHHHYPPAPPPVPRAPGWMKAAVAGTALAAAVLGSSYLTTLLNRPAPQPPAPINTKVETREGFLLDLEQAEPKK